MIKPATYHTATPDKALPKADTCFFNLELPDYSSKEVLKERLLLAINTDCDSINADQLINLDPNAQYNERGSDFEDVDDYDDYWKNKWNFIVMIKLLHEFQVICKL